MMVEVAVKVPEERVAEFYSMFGEWLQSQSSAIRRPEPWGPSDREAAKTVLAGVPANSARMLEVLSSGEELDSSEVVQRAGFNDAGQLPGISGWVGRIARQHGREAPIKTRQKDGTTYWRLDPDVAAFFKATS